LFDPALKAFPPAFVVRPPPGPARTWFDASIAYALEESSGQRRIRSTKLPELLLIEVLRLHLANAPASERGWLAGLRDPLLAPAIKAIHAAPERKRRRSAERSNEHTGNRLAGGARAARPAGRRRELTRCGPPPGNPTEERR
jgi:hypothetical protein